MQLCRIVQPENSVRSSFCAFLWLQGHVQWKQVECFLLKQWKFHSDTGCVRCVIAFSPISWALFCLPSIKRNTNTIKNTHQSTWFPFLDSHGDFVRDEHQLSDHLWSYCCIFHFHSSLLVKKSIPSVLIFTLGRNQPVYSTKNALDKGVKTASCYCWRSKNCDSPQCSPEPRWSHLNLLGLH